MRIALLTSSRHKAEEFAAALAGHGQKVTAVPFDGGDVSEVVVKNLLADGYSFLIREETSLTASFNRRPITERPRDMDLLTNISKMSVWHAGDEGEPRKTSYSADISGFIDLDLNGGTDVFGWDDVFVPLEAGRNLHALKQDGIKTSARQINIGRFLADHIHFRNRLDMRFFPMRQDRSIEFSTKAFDFVTTNNLIRKGTAGHWLENTLSNVLNSGIFFRSAANRKEKNYWVPGLNAGIPLTEKKDAVHEITFLFHDLMHFQLPDLIPDVTDDFAKQVYVTHRVLGEALTLVLADMVFIDNLAQAGVDYDFSKRLIYPLFQHMAVGSTLDDLKPLVRAMAYYAILGDDSLLRSLLEPGEAAMSSLEAFKQKYGRFFSEDVRWTERNFDQFAAHSDYISRWMSCVSQDTLADNGLTTLSRFMLGMNCGRDPGAEAVLDDILDIVFKRVVVPNARHPATTLAGVCVSNAFRRYMIGQMSFFARYSRIFDMPAIRSKLTRKIAGRGTLSADDIKGMRHLFDLYVKTLAERQIIDPSDAITYVAVHPLFPPFYVFYDTTKPAGTDGSLETVA